MRNKPAFDNVVQFRRPHAEEPNRNPAGMKTDPRKATFWTWLSSCLTEGFALYGASMYPPALYLFDDHPTDTKQRQPAGSPPSFPNAIIDQDD
jgi:hypothetical protein